MKTISIICGLLLTYTLSGQQHLSAYISDNQQLTANITLQEGYTLYGLSKAIGADVATIQGLNPNINTNSMELKTTLRLPINPEMLSADPTGLANPIVVTYQVQPQETLFKIAKVYANQEVEVIKQLNKIVDNTLSIGQEVIIGYINWPYNIGDKPLLGNRELILPTEPIADTITRYVIGDDITIIGPATTDSIMAPNIHTNVKGIALMENRGGGTQELVVIHKSADIDSEIEIYNPMMRRRVKARVVAQIPRNSYPEDVSVVISPAVASALGALDRRFMVEMTYLAAN